MEKYIYEAFHILSKGLKFQQEKLQDKEKQTRLA